MFACLYAEIAMPLLPGIPLTVLDDVPVATVDPLPQHPHYPQTLQSVWQGTHSTSRTNTKECPPYQMVTGPPLLGNSTLD